MRRQKAFTSLEESQIRKVPERRSGFLMGFTLIELLVVISILVLLMAVLLPTLQRVRMQAKAAKCQANLHQWGLMFSMYTVNNDGKFFMPMHGDTWIEPMEPYYKDCKDSLFLCPMATKHYIENPTIEPALDSATKKRLWALKYTGGGTKFHAWLLFEPKPFCSYGLNDWVMDYQLSGSGTDSLWRISDIKEASNVPVFLDCVWRGARPHYLDPPLVDGDYPPKTALSPDEYYAMQYFCINRHDGFINSLFMDSSVRKVGLKQLWTLRWHRWFNTAGPWTKAGGASGEDWPQWMRHLKGY